MPRPLPLQLALLVALQLALLVPLLPCTVAAYLVDVQHQVQLVRIIPAVGIIPMLKAIPTFRITISEAWSQERQLTAIRG